MYPKNNDSAKAAREGVNPSPSFPAVEQGILAFWKGDDTFQASIDQRTATNAEEFVFYDGPPFANGLPHYGHLLTGYTKDMVPRFKTMQGYRVERRFGWDTHGLPAEVEAERQLGISGRHEIEAVGIDKFNEACRSSVLKYTKEWEAYVTRQARWVDFENDYKTLDTNYTESVLWAFKELHNKGLIYEGFKVLAYCWRCETPLSNHELRMDDEVYKNRQDQTLTVTFPVSEGQALEGVRLLAWTTTPWTLPTNFALAVGPEITYVVVAAGPHGAADGGAAGTKYLLAKNVVGGFAKDLGYESAEALEVGIVETYQGSELAGSTTTPMNLSSTPQTPGPFSSMTTLATETEPESFTRRPPTVRMTSEYVWPPESRPTSRSTTEVSSTRSSPTSRDSTCSRPTSRFHST
jgi:isoleucyl-tRNA synthetase